MKQITPTELKNKLELDLAKEWGYNSVKKALLDGMNVKRLNCTVKEMRNILKISDNEARHLVYEWKANGLINYVAACGLDQIQFKY